MVDAGTSEAGPTEPASSSKRRESAIKRARRAVLELTPFQRAALAVLVCCVVAGVWLRTRAMFTNIAPLWGDEALWALRLKGGVPDNGLRPPGFMAVSKLLAEAFSWREFGLRFLPWLCGLLTLFTSVALAPNLFRTTAARLFFVATIAFNPAAIDLGKEFKPYSGSLFMHACGALLAILYWNNRRERWLWLAGLWALVSVLFAQDALFAYPGVFGAMALRAFLEGPRRERVLVVAAATLSLITVGLMYFFLWRHLNAGLQGDATQYWGGRYDVFFRGEGSRVAWLFDKQLEVAAFPGVRRASWAHTHASLAGFDAGFWGLLHLAGLVALLVQKRFGNALILVTPIAVALTFNALGYWPYGPFRTNLFLVFYAAAIAAAAMDWPRLPWQPAWSVAALGVVLLPLAAFEREFHSHKGTAGFVGHSVMPDALAALLTLRERGLTEKDGEVLVLDRNAFDTFNYYTQLNPDYSARAELIREQFQIHTSHSSTGTLQMARRYLNRGEPQVWVLFQNEGMHTIGRRLSRNRLKVTHKDEIQDSGALLIRVVDRRAPDR